MVDLLLLHLSSAPVLLPLLQALSQHRAPHLPRLLLQLKVLAHACFLIVWHLCLSTNTLFKAHKTHKYTDILPINRNGFLLSIFLTESLSSIISTRLPITQGPTPTTTPGLNTTCSVLKDTAANAQIFECTSDTTQPCDRIFCSEEIGGKNYDAVIVLLPCSDSPAVRVELSRNNGAVGVNETVDSSREIPVPGPLGFSMVVTVDHFPDALGLQVGRCKWSS